MSDLMIAAEVSQASHTDRVIRNRIIGGMRNLFVTFDAPHIVLICSFLSPFASKEKIHSSGSLV